MDIPILGVTVKSYLVQQKWLILLDVLCSTQQQFDIPFLIRFKPKIFTLKPHNQKIRTRIHNISFIIKSTYIILISMHTQSYTLNSKHF